MIIPSFYYQINQNQIQNQIMNKMQINKSYNWNANDVTSNDITIN